MSKNERKIQVLSSFPELNSTIDLISNFRTENPIFKMSRNASKNYKQVYKFLKDKLQTYFDDSIFENTKNSDFLKNSMVIILPGEPEEKINYSTLKIWLNGEFSDYLLENLNLILFAGVVGHDSSLALVIYLFNATDVEEEDILDIKSDFYFQIIRFEYYHEFRKFEIDLEKYEEELSAQN